MSGKEKSDTEKTNAAIRRLSEDIEDLKKRIKYIEDTVMRQKTSRRWV